AFPQARGEREPVMREDRAVERAELPHPRLVRVTAEAPQHDARLGARVEPAREEAALERAREVLPGDAALFGLEQRRAGDALARALVQRAELRPLAPAVRHARELAGARLELRERLLLPVVVRPGECLAELAPARADLFTARSGRAQLVDRGS